MPHILSKLSALLHFQPPIEGEEAWKSKLSTEAPASTDATSHDHLAKVALRQGQAPSCCPKTSLGRFALLSGDYPKPPQTKTL